MKFKVDENLPTDIAVLLRSCGHEATTVADEGLLGSEDAVLASRLKREPEAVVTHDRHFADIRAYPPDHYPGIIVLRTKFPDKPRILLMVRQILPLLRSEPLAGNLWIVEEDRVRMRRKLPSIGGRVIELPLDTEGDKPTD